MKPRTYSALPLVALTIVLMFASVSYGQNFGLPKGPDGVILITKRRLSPDFPEMILNFRSRSLSPAAIG